jgi:hypothetical protein
MRNWFNLYLNWIGNENSKPGLKNKDIIVDLNLKFRFFNAVGQNQNLFSMTNQAIMKMMLHN